MEDIAKALTEFTHALGVMEWLRENGLLPADADIGELAFGYACNYTSPKVISAFRAVAQIEQEHRARVAAMPKRQRAATTMKAAQEHLDRLAAEDAIRENALRLASELAPVAS